MKHCLRHARALLVLLAAFILFGCQPTKMEPLPSASVALERCKTAYSKLSSYQGRTHVISKVVFEEKAQEMSAESKIQYVSPNKIRVSGNLASMASVPEMGTYEFVSDGSETWMRSKISGNKWTKAESVDMAIASFTGVSNQAATTIAAIFANSNWGNPFGTIDGAKIVSEKLNGKRTYKISGKQVNGEVELWIDQETSLLVKRVQKYDSKAFNNIEFPEHKEALKLLEGLDGMETTEQFLDVQIDKAMDESAFKCPPK